MFDFNDYMLDIVLSKVKKTIDIRKFDNTKILINTDDEMLNYFTLKKFATWIIRVIKDHGKFHPQIFLEKALFVNEATKFYALLLCSHYFFNTHLSRPAFSTFNFGKLQPWTKLVETKVKSSQFKKWSNFWNCKFSPLPLPLISMLNLAKFCCHKPKTLRTTLILREMSFFTNK